MKSLIIILTLIILNFPVYSNWEKVDSPEGGSISQIIPYKNSLYTLSINSGVYSYNYQNEKWDKLNKSNDLLRLTKTFYIDTINKIFYLVTDNNGVFKSTDEQNWIKIHSGKNYNNIFINISKIHSYGQYVIFISDREIYISSDYGDNWENINSNLTKELIIYDFILFESKIYLATNQGLFISNDYGKSWDSVVFDGGLVYGIYNINGKIIATIVNTLANPVVFETYEKEIDSDNFKSYSENRFNGYQVLDIANDGDNIAILTLESKNFTYNYRISFSNNNGNTWTEVIAKESNNLQYFSANLELVKNVIYVGTLYDGIYSIEIDGKNEKLINSGLNGYILNSYLENNNISITSSVNSGIYYKDKQSTNWLRSESSPLLLDIQNNIIFYNNIRNVIKINNQFIAATQKGLHQSTDGVEWKGFALSEYNISTIKEVNNILYALGEFTSMYLFVSTDFGETWSSKPLPNMTSATSFMVDEKEVYVASSAGLIKTVDNGNNWLLINSNFIENDVIFSISKQKNNSIIVNTRNNIFISYDGGVSFIKIGNILNNAEINKVFTYDNVTIAATNLGTAFSYDYGKTWNINNAGLDSPNIMEISKIDTTIYAFQASGGIYRTGINSSAPIFISNKINQSICSGTSIQINYEVNKGITFNPENKFYVQLSNNKGVFDDSSIIIGEVNSTSSGTINALIPDNQIEGNKYRFRVISTSPAIIGIDNLVDISIFKKPNPIIAGELNVCQNKEYSYSIDLTEGFNYKWTIANGVIIGEDNKSSVLVKWDKPGSGSLNIELSGIDNCDGGGNITVIINPTPEKPIISFVNNKLVSNYDAGNQWFFEGSIIQGATSKEYQPTSEGNYTLQISNEFSCLSEFSDPYNFQDISDKIVFKIDTVNSYTGDDAWINIRLIKNKKFQEIDINSISFDLVFNASLLYPKINDKGLIIDGNRYLKIESDTNYINDNIIVTIPMRVMLGNSDKTEISIQNLKINGQNFDEFFTYKGMLNLLDVCYDGGPRLITSEPYIKIEKVSPNPIIGNFNVSFYASEDQSAQFYITDILGNKIEKLFEGNITKGLQTIDFILRNHPFGEYYLIAENKNGNSIYKIIITR